MNRITTRIQWPLLRRAAGAALAAGLFLPAHAAVIDDMNPCSPTLYGFNKTDITHECQNGEMTLRVIHELGPWDALQGSGFPGSKHFTLDVVYREGYPDIPLLEGQTLELRLDYVRSNRDDVFAYLAYFDREIGADILGSYILARDWNEIVLLKGAGAPWSEIRKHYTVMSWDYGAETDEPVTMVLALTRLGDTVEITGRILLRADPTQVLFERTVRDGPGIDFPVDGPVGPKGYLSVPDVGAAYGEMGITQSVGMSVMNEGGEPFSEVVIDNFEYTYYPAVAALTIAPAVKLEFGHTPTPQIVLSAPAVDGPWTPRVESLHRTGEQWEMAVPVTDRNMFFKLAPGFAAEEDFEPGLSENWLLLAAPGMEELFALESVESGTFRNHRLSFAGKSGSALEDGGVALLREDPDTVDFAVQVDVPRFSTASGTEAGLIARMQAGEELNGYVAGVSLGQSADECLPGKLWIRQVVNGVSQPLAERCPDTRFLMPNGACRLRFSGTGNQLTVGLTLPDRPDLTIEPLVVEDGTFSQGGTGFWLSLPTFRSIVIVDDFRTVGTLPE